MYPYKIDHAELVKHRFFNPLNPLLLRLYLLGAEALVDELKLLGGAESYLVNLEFDPHLSHQPRPDLNVDHPIGSTAPDHNLLDEVVEVEDGLCLFPLPLIAREDHCGEDLGDVESIAELKDEVLCLDQTSILSCSKALQSLVLLQLVLAEGFENGELGLILRQASLEGLHELKHVGQ